MITEPTLRSVEIPEATDPRKPAIRAGRLLFVNSKGDPLRRWYAGMKPRNTAIGAVDGALADMGYRSAAGQSHIGLAAVLFDMDGTLVDTEKAWEVALRELAARYGGVLSDRARAAMVGGSSATTMRLMSEDLGLPGIDADEGADWLDARMLELFAEGLPWRPGARELLAAVRDAGIPTGLVTNTRRPLVEVALRTLGVHNFDALICGDDVSDPKPHPAHYLTAAAAFAAPPGHCVAIEDSPTGIASARGAGCAVLGIPNEVPLDGLDVPVRASLLEVDLPLLRSLVPYPTR